MAGMHAKGLDGDAKIEQGSSARQHQAAPVGVCHAQRAAGIGVQFDAVGGAAEQPGLRVVDRRRENRRFERRSHFIRTFAPEPDAADRTCAASSRPTEVIGRVMYTSYSVSGHAGS